MLGFGRPRCSLKLGPHHAAWVELVRDRLGRSQCRFGVAELPADLLRPSPVETNIRDRTALEGLLRALIGSETNGARALRPTVLVLPDLCVRAVLLEMDTVPAKPAEREALIRWRLERQGSFPMAGTKVVTQVLAPTIVLAVVIREAVLRDYESVCEAVGLLPVDVDIASFRVWNVCTQAAPSAEPEAWLSLLDEGFTFLIHHTGRIQYLRSKRRSSGVLEDLVASLRLYTESNPQSPPRRLLLLGEPADAVLVPVISRELGLEVVQIGWEAVRDKRRPVAEDGAPLETLPALAGLVGG